MLARQCRQGAHCLKPGVVAAITPHVAGHGVEYPHLHGTREAGTGTGSRTKTGAEAGAGAGASAGASTGAGAGAGAEECSSTCTGRGITRPDCCTMLITTLPPKECPMSITG